MIYRITECLRIQYLKFTASYPENKRKKKPEYDIITFGLKKYILR